MKIGDLQAAFPVERVSRVGRLLFFCAVVGVAAGVGAIVFHVMIGFVEHHLLDGLAGYRVVDDGTSLFGRTSTPLNRAWLFVLPAIGGLLSGVIVHFWAFEVKGPGTGSVIGAYHQRDAYIRRRVPYAKLIASAVTLGTGGSAGREGPIAQIGAGIGSALADRMRLSPHERRILMAAGMAAGVGAIFQAPLAAALFAAEVLYREMDLEVEAIVPAVIASIVAHSVFTQVFGAAPLFTAPEMSFTGPIELVPYFTLALVVALGAKLYVVSLEGAHGWFERLQVPAPLKPALGGLGVGAIALVVPDAIGSGYHWVQSAIDGQVAASALIGIALFKIIATSLTVSSGGSGGVFGPAIVIGGSLGGFVGAFWTTQASGISPPMAAFVIVGMAGFFSAAANTPISTILMVAEISRSFDLLGPSMWVCIIAFLLVRRSSIYAQQPRSRHDSPVHLGSYLGGVLQTLTVADALADGANAPVVTVRASTPMTEVLELFASTHHDSFPIVDGAGRLIGIVDDQSLRQAIGTEGISQFIVAQDLAEQAPLLFITDTLHIAMHKMVSSRHDELVVVDENDQARIVGTLSRRDLIAAYDHQIQTDLAEKARDGSLFHHTPSDS